MRPSSFPIVDEASDEPRFVALARAVSGAIASGRLKPGDALPGSRTIAESAGVNRNTVLAALRELRLEGWIETAGARGTFVSRDLPERSARGPRAALPPRDEANPVFELRGETPTDLGQRHHRAADPLRVPYPLLGGWPDTRLVPHAEIARAFRRALARHPSELLAYGDTRGDVRLRRALAELLAQTRGVVAGEDGVLVTRGSQMAIALAARVTLARGDVVAVEAYGYRPAWEALRAAGAELVPMPVDAGGLCVHSLGALARRRKVRAVYVTPHHQYPTTATLPAARRLALLDLAKRERFAILEDDYDHEFHYDGRPTLPLASADDGTRVIYVGTLSKVLAPGLRIGFLVAPRALLERAATLRAFIDRQGDLAVERAVAEIVEDGLLARHTRKMRRLYKERRDALVAAVRKELPMLAFEVPAGGLALWVEARGRKRALDVDAWAERAAARGVLVQTARRFTFDGHAEPKLRLGFAPLDPHRIREAIARLAGALTRAS
jgi:GntR family transcriptional regulator / MocR family aminotransferase